MREAITLTGRSVTFIRRLCIERKINARLAGGNFWLIHRQNLLDYLAFEYKRAGKPKDLAGQRFGRLTALKIHSRKFGMIQWLCRCDCGNEKVACGTNLSKGKTKSCGCIVRNQGYKKDLAGRRFGKLTVLEYSHSKSNKPYWRCLCDCGNEKTIRGHNFVTGNTKSCGQCPKTVRMISEEVIKEYLSRSKQLDSLFNQITKDYCGSQCHYEHIGCCGDNFFVGGSSKQLIKLQEKEALENGWDSQKQSGNCKYHSDKGCFLEFAKSPLCIGTFCQEIIRSLEEKYPSEMISAFIEEVRSFRTLSLSYKPEVILGKMDVAIRLGETLIKKSIKNPV